MAMQRNTYSNWNGRVHVSPDRIARPADEAALVQEIVGAADRGVPVKAVGSGHSFNAIMATTGTLVDMSRFDRVLAIDHERRLVRVQSGMKLRDLVVVLERNGLALPNIGAWMEQTISGVLATGTHGTGGRWRHNLTDALVSYRLVDGRGTVRIVDGDDIRWLPLGYFGVVTEVTLRCVPLFFVTHRRRIGDLVRAIDGLDDALAEHDFVDLRFVGAITRGALSTWDVTEAPPSLVDHARFELEGVRQYAINHAVQGWARLGALPVFNRRIYRAVGELYMRDGESAPTTSVWWKGLTFNSRSFAPAHDEYEFALPREHTREFLREAAAEMQRRWDTPSLEIQVRFSEATDIVLAPNRDRSTMWFNINVFDARDANPAVHRLAEIVRAWGGRPHWCKCVPWFFNGDPVADIDAWEQVRRGYDPMGMFLNAYYHQHLTPSMTSVATRPASAEENLAA
jgi:FAD/FMN-containing dehydrogenase